MTLSNAYLVKGFLIAKEAPQRIVQAVDDIISALDHQHLQIEGKLIGFGDSEEAGESVQSTGFIFTPPPPARIEETPVEVPKKKREWSPEARAAAAERMRQTQARKKAAAPSSHANSPRPEHGEFIGKRKGGVLLNSDWPDIKNMLPKLTPEAIAEKYGTTKDALAAFVAQRNAQEMARPDTLAAKPKEAPKWDYRDENISASD